MLAAAIQSKLFNEAELTKSLGTFEFDDSNTLPAIFVGAPPDEVQGAHIEINDLGELGSFGTRAQRGGLMGATVRIVAENSGSEKPVQTIAQLLWTLLDRASIKPEGFESCTLKATLPSPVAVEGGFPARELTINTFVLEEVSNDE